MLLYQILESTVNGKIKIKKKTHAEKIDLKYQLLRGALFKFELPDEKLYF